MDELILKLLESVKDHPRQLSLSKSPVSSIDACFKMVEMGLVFLGESEYYSDLVFITEEGKQFLKEHNV